MRKYSIENVAIVALLAAGVLLSLFQFLYNRSLWADEAMLALNIIQRNAFELLQPLDYEQVAPILFLQIEKLFSTILPNTEYGLRIFPLLCFWASIYFFYKIVKIQLNNTYAIIIALSLFVFNGILIYYSSEIKQYMTDVLVLLTLFYLVQKDYKKEKNKFYIMGIVGALAIFLSNVAPIILLTCGLCLLYDEFFITKRRRIMPLSVVFVVWLGVFLVYYIFFIYEHPLKESMIGMWERAFLPFDSFQNFLHFSLVTQKWFFPMFLVDNKIIKIVLFLSLNVGIVNLIRRRKSKLIILTCLPLLLHLFLSSIQLYPFAARFVLYILPGIIIIFSIGFRDMSTFLFDKLRITKYKLWVLLPIPLLFFSQDIPKKTFEIKKSIVYLRENAREDEAIYVYGYLQNPFKYYQITGYAKNIKAKVVYRDFILMDKDGNSEELKNLHGKNWLFFASSLWKDEEFAVGLLDSMRVKRTKSFNEYKSPLYLYDFGE
jgi:hypothetical protein